MPSGAVTDREQGGRRRLSSCGRWVPGLSSSSGGAAPAPPDGRGAGGGGRHSCRKTAQARARRRVGAGRRRSPGRCVARGRAAHGRGAGRGSQLPPGRPGSEAGLSRAMGACAGTPRAWGRGGGGSVGALVYSLPGRRRRRPPQCVGRGYISPCACRPGGRDPGRTSPRHPAWSPARAHLGLGQHPEPAALVVRGVQGTSRNVVRDTAVRASARASAATWSIRRRPRPWRVNAGSTLICSMWPRRPPRRPGQ